MTPLDAGWALVNAGFNGYRVPTFIAIGQAESRLNELAIGLNKHDPNSPSYLSLDLGVWQINTYWWVDLRLRVQDLFNPYYNAQVAWSVFVSSGGTNLNPIPGYRAWNSYKNGLHMPFLSEAQQVWTQMGRP